MANYLTLQGRTWHVKVAIPADVQGVFGKRAFKQTLKTSDKTVAITRSGPLIAQFKRDIEDARGNPIQSLDEYLKETQAFLRKAKANRDTDPDAIAAIEDELRDRLLAANGVRDLSELPEQARPSAIKTFKVATGRQTLFAAPLEEYVASRRVEPKTEAKDRHAIAKFASRVSTVEEVDRQSVRDFVKRLSVEEGLKNRTIKNNLSTLRVYWKWLADHDYAPEDRVNPFENVTLPPENRKAAA